MYYLSKSASQYRITMDEAWQHERPEVRNHNRRWYEQIPCRGGAFIALLKEDPEPVLQLYTPLVKSARAIFKRIKDHPGVSADFG